ncbi:triose-phosphate isomerase [Patescibacteria group bacterium]|nr:triose-phosphate isomerase [Patescibacteria group bacterium]MBU0777394.1 triose-phosphate isomerase [Patescibacteria group bacterium]MBU0846030.1 triose-phosphate isomerase [Patescibacteria group bacterium]MBU0922470.1 triose-phosphate isomerase [Patescibacteria group bacterium]MBU1066797.1 triose-phosphate isomerase [Patescibacteria group bacterium]
MIFINFKTYKEGSGEKAIDLVKIIEGVSEETQIKIIPVVQATDIKEIVGGSKLEVWAQNVDLEDYGAHTGAILPEAVFEDGALGTFLNHSEKKLPDFDKLEAVVKRAKEVNLKTLIFASDVAELVKILSLKPTYAAYEPPELIGSKTTSVSQAQPELIAKAVSLSNEAGIPLIVGAGVSSARDVKKCVELGAVGVAVASDVVVANDPKKELLDLTEGFK